MSAIWVNVPELTDRPTQTAADIEDTLAAQLQAAREVIGFPRATRGHVAFAPDELQHPDHRLVVFEVAAREAMLARFRR